MRIITTIAIGLFIAVALLMALGTICACILASKADQDVEQTWKQEHGASGPEV